MARDKEPRAGIRGASAATLPHVDEHVLRVVASRSAVWLGLVAAVEAAFTGPVVEAYARLVGCTPYQSSGPRPLSAGSTLPGFAVVAAEPGRRLVLEGSHRYSSYALVLRIEAAPEGWTVHADTRAVFAGIAGGVYRRVVLGTGAHALGVRRLLHSVQRRAERAPRGAP